jgi:hypothetical protein
MSLEQLIKEEIAKRNNKSTQHENTFVELENQIKTKAIRERLKSKMDIYMMCRCF